jgi:WXXGXW repeat (2 copies)
MNVVHPLVKLRHLLLVPLALAALSSTPVFAQTEVIIRQAPPPMRMEPAPGVRPGYAWDQGHWRWDGRGYAWEPGHWQPMRHHSRWMPGHWQARGPNWVWVEGRWVR